MTTLIVPCAGRSLRFNNRPKWAITHPSGKMLIEESIAKLDLSEIDRIVFTVTRDQLIKLNLQEKNLPDVFEYQPHHLFDFVILEEPTESQPETICQTILKAGIVGPFVVKDCDNQFQWKPTNKKSVAVKRVAQSDDIRFLQQKSFVTEKNNLIENIVEKKPMGDLICVGGYSFDDSEEFVKTYYGIRSSIQREPYISDIIGHMIKNGSQFGIDYAVEYVDWGTAEIWRDFRRQFKTFFVDVDGVLMQNGSRCFFPTWEQSKPIMANIQALMAYPNGYIIACTARPEALREATLKQLTEAGLRVDRLIMGLPHSQRVLINDYNENSAPFPTAHSVNIERNAEDLSRILKNL